MYTVLRIMHTTIHSLHEKKKIGSNNNKDCVIMGNFNCNTINKYDPSTHDFLSLATFNSFHPLHYLPTRVYEKSASTLDIIFTNVTNMSCLPGIIIDDISDHFPICHL